MIYTDVLHLSPSLSLRDKLLDKEKSNAEDEEGDGANVKSSAETHLIQWEAPSNQISENTFVFFFTLFVLLKLLQVFKKKQPGEIWNVV